MNAGRAQRRHTASCHARLRCSQRATRKNPSRFCWADLGGKKMRPLERVRAQRPGLRGGAMEVGMRWRSAGVRQRARGPGGVRHRAQFLGVVLFFDAPHRWLELLADAGLHSVGTDPVATCSRPLVLTLKRRRAPLSRCCSKTSDSRFARGWLQRGAACLLQFLHLAAVVCSDCMPIGTARPKN